MRGALCPGRHAALEVVDYRRPGRERDRVEVDLDIRPRGALNAPDDDDHADPCTGTCTKDRPKRSGKAAAFRQGGLEALEDAPRQRAGVQVLDDDVKAILCRLKRDVPARSVDRVIDIAEEMGLVPTGVLKRSTVHRVLRSRGLSPRKKGEASTARARAACLSNR